VTTSAPATHASANRSIHPEYRFRPSQATKESLVGGATGKVSRAARIGREVRFPILLVARFAPLVPRGQSDLVLIGRRSLPRRCEDPLRRHFNPTPIGIARLSTLDFFFDRSVLQRAIPQKIPGQSRYFSSTNSFSAAEYLKVDFAQRMIDGVRDQHLFGCGPSRIR